ncbi:MAG TPA: carboxypeptidase-like regulatory domain-containing protein [Polyangiaceae bacterium]
MSAREESTAESLFREGRQLLADGQVAEACDRFAESQRLEPSPGTLLNLARCHADAGMTATAWGEYLAAARLARSQERPQQAAEAELRAEELQPRLVRLRIELDPRTPGVVVTRNGEQLAPSDLHVPLVVDPGSYVIRATAPGHSPFTTTVLVAQPGQVRTVVIPALAAVPSAVATPPRRPPAPGAVPAAPVAEQPGISARTWIAAGVGGAALVTSAILAGVAKSKWDDAHEQGLCDESHACNQAGLTETDQARRLGNLATGFGLAGLAAGACAVIFYSTDASKRNAKVQARVAFDPGSVVVGVRGGF